MAGPIYRVTYCNEILLRGVNFLGVEHGVKIRLGNHPGRVRNRGYTV